MKKLTCLLVMLLLGSGLTKAFVWDNVNGYPSFTFWNINATQDAQRVYLVRGESYATYIYFVAPTDITELKVETHIHIAGVSLPGGQAIKLELYRSCLPAQAQQPIELMGDIEVSTALPKVSAQIEIRLKNQNDVIVAAGVVHVNLE